MTYSKSFGRHEVPQSLIYLAAHRAGGVVQDVPEALVLSVDIAYEVLRALRQVEYRPEVDDLRADRLNGRIGLG